VSERTIKAHRSQVMHKMDVQSGAELGQAVEWLSAAHGPCPPVIFVTAEEDEAVREQARRVSGNLCLRKPLAGAVLLEAVRAQLRLRAPI